MRHIRKFCGVSITTEIQLIFKQPPLPTILPFRCTLRGKCPNTEFFLVRIFLHSVRIQENTDQKQLRIWTVFTQWQKGGIVPSQISVKNHINLFRTIRLI